LNTFSPQGKAYTQPFTYATKVIDEASDLAVFDLGSKAYAQNTGMVVNANEFDGYYVLTKDIDCAGYVHSVTTNEASTSWEKLSVSGHSNVGLTGVFEGNGHTISNLSLNRRGLFGVIVGGTVQNVGFTNLVFTRDTATANAVYHARDTYALACVIEKATLKNVYVHIPTMQISVTVASGTLMTGSGSALRGAGLASSIDGSTVMENCVIKIDEYNYMSNANYNGGSLMCVADSTEGAYANFKNVYVISNAMLAGSKANEATRADASNQTETTITIAGVKRYASIGDMQKDATANAEDLNTFDSKYWTVTDGVLSWN